MLQPEPEPEDPESTKFGKNSHLTVGGGQNDLGIIYSVFIVFIIWRCEGPNTFSYTSAQELFEASLVSGPLLEVNTTFTGTEAGLVSRQGRQVSGVVRGLGEDSSGDIPPDQWQSLKERIDQITRGETGEKYNVRNVINYDGIFVISLIDYRVGLPFLPIPS